MRSDYQAPRAVYFVLRITTRAWQAGIPLGTVTPIQLITLGRPLIDLLSSRFGYSRWAAGCAGWDRHWPDPRALKGLPCSPQILMAASHRASQPG